MSSSEAIASIRKCLQSGVQILGVDGFVVLPDGIRADLDLMLDVSERSTSAAEVAAEAEAFIDKHARPDLVWQVWTEVP